MPTFEIRAWIYSLLVNISILLLGIVTGVLVARLLLPEGRGALSAILFWPQFVAGIGLLSLPQAITYITGRQNCELDKGTLLATSALLALLLSIAVGLITYPILPYLLTEAGYPYLLHTAVRRYLSMNRTRTNLHEPH